MGDKFAASAKTFFFARTSHIGTIPALKGSNSKFDHGETSVASMSSPSSEVSSQHSGNRKSPAICSINYSVASLGSKLQQTVSIAASLSRTTRFEAIPNKIA